MIFASTLAFRFLARVPCPAFLHKELWLEHVSWNIPFPFPDAKTTNKTNAASCPALGFTPWFWYSSSICAWYTWILSSSWTCVPLAVISIRSRGYSYEMASRRNNVCHDLNNQVSDCPKRWWLFILTIVSEFGVPNSSLWDIWDTSKGSHLLLFLGRKFSL